MHLLINCTVWYCYWLIYAVSELNRILFNFKRVRFKYLKWKLYYEFSLKLFFLYQQFRYLKMLLKKTSELAFSRYFFQFGHFLRNEQSKCSNQCVVLTVSNDSMNVENQTNRTYLILPNVWFLTHSILIHRTIIGVTNYLDGVVDLVCFGSKF